jgi:hypothetical protein
MEQKTSPLESVAEKANDYLNTRLELGRLKALEYGALAFSAILGKLIILMVCFCILIFASLALAIYLSITLRNAWIGCLIVAGLYLLLFFVIYFNRKKLLDHPLANLFIRQITGNHEN